MACQHGLDKCVICDTAGRTDKDYAIEFGEYLAAASSHLLRKLDVRNDMPLDAELNDALSAVCKAAYEFRKRAARAGHAPSAIAIK